METENIVLPKPKILTQPQKAVWGRGRRKYKRHSVERDFKKFLGFKNLRRIVEAAHPELVKAFIFFLWATGGRVTEVLNLQKKMFTLRTDTEPPILIVDGAPLEKRYEKVAEYIECSLCGEPNHASKECATCGPDLLAHSQRRLITERHVDKERNEFAIRLDDPFADTIPSWLKGCDDYLFLNRMAGSARILNLTWKYQPSIFPFHSR